MLKSKIEQFVAKKAVICLILLSIIDIIVIKNRWLVLTGLVVGTILSIVKFSGYAGVFRQICQTGRNTPPKSRTPIGSILVFILNQIILLPLLFLAYYLNQWLFAGFVAGILTVPFVLMVNSITEILGITKNHFE